MNLFLVRRFSGFNVYLNERINCKYFENEKSPRNLLRYNAVGYKCQ